MSSPQDPIYLNVTMPRVGGVSGMIIRGVLGVADLADMFKEAQMASPTRVDPNHVSFLLQLEHDIEVGGRTKAGLLAVANEKGQIRFTTPWSWAGPLRTAGFEPTKGVDELGKAVAQVWVAAEPGAHFEMRLPMKTPLRIRIEVVARP